MPLNLVRNGRDAGAQLLCRFDPSRLRDDDRFRRPKKRRSTGTPADPMVEKDTDETGRQ